MIKITREIFTSPQAIFIMYVLSAGLVIMGFHFIFPGEPVPLDYFSFQWRLIQGFLEYIDLFPALILTSLAIPYGFIIHTTEKNVPFSLALFDYFKDSIVTAIIASTLYGLLFTLALPLTRNFEANILYQSRLYHLAFRNAQENADDGEWEETAQLLAIADRIWPNSPETSRLRLEADIELESARLYRAALPYTAADSLTWPGTPRELTVTDAIVMAETALAEQRFFDAHWLATVGGRLARPNSPEQASATRLSGLAWAGINSMAPSERETRAFNNFRLKREGFEAMLGSEWVRAYFIFRELLEVTPNDPDVVRYLALSEEGVQNVAFFIDEIELSLGQILTGALFSLPLHLDRGMPQGRLVMRVSSLSTGLDYAYGIDAEMMAFDRQGQPLWTMTVPYIKLLPVTLNSESAVTVFLRALQRYDRETYWAPEVTTFAGPAPGESEITLPIAWDNFLLLSNVRRGISLLSTADLRRAADNLGGSGYLPEMFEAELLKRFTHPLFMLPFGIFAIGLGWQYRALKRPRYIAIPMLGILPVVFHAAIHFTKNLLGDISIWGIVTFGFTVAAIIFGLGILLLLIISLIVLSSRHS